MPIPACDTEAPGADCDNDTITNGLDNCPAVANMDQLNSDSSDGDTFGDACDVDDDNDGLIDIATAAELDNVRNDLDGSHYDTSTNDSAQSNMGCPSGGCSGYELTASIALAAPQAPATSNWVPIGDSTNLFAATFEGNGFGITELNVRASGAVGFFGSVHADGVVRNLHVAGTLTATGTATIGGLAGLNHGVVSGCSALVTVTGSTSTLQDSIGGLVGQNRGTVENSSSSGTVTGGLGDNDSVGGLMGSSANSDAVRNSWSDVAVTGGASGTTMGGLVGSSSDITISNNYATGAITGGDGDDFIGGLTAAGSVAYSYAANTMINGGSGTNTIGGLLAVGVFGLQTFTITSSYHTHTGGASITGATQVTADQLTGCTIGGMKITGADASLDCSTNSLFTGWSTNNWDFGTASQFPALRSYKEDSDGAQIAGDIMCGQPGQPGTTPTRATRTECVGALVPLP